MSEAERKLEGGETNTGRRQPRHLARAGHLKTLSVSSTDSSLFHSRSQRPWAINLPRFIGDNTGSDPLLLASDSPSPPIHRRSPRVSDALAI